MNLRFRQLRIHLTFLSAAILDIRFGVRVNGLKTANREEHTNAFYVATHDPTSAIQSAQVSEEYGLCATHYTPLSVIASKNLILF
jgi:hypothetical protein